jgi:hypothetical protein
MDGRSPDVSRDSPEALMVCRGAYLDSWAAWKVRPGDFQVDCHRFRYQVSVSEESLPEVARIPDNLDDSRADSGP